MNIVDEAREVEETDPDQAKRYISTNRHNSTTTIYYLLLKKYLRKGGTSIADIKKYNPNEFKRQSDAKSKLALIN